MTYKDINLHLRNSYPDTPSKQEEDYHIIFTKKIFQVPDCDDEVDKISLRLPKGFPPYARARSKATAYIPRWRLC